LQSLAPMPRDELPEPKQRRRTIHKAILASVGALLPVILVLLAWKAANGLLLLFAGFLVAVLFRGLAELVEQRSRLSYRWSLATVLLLILAVLVGAGFLLAPQIQTQVAELSTQIPQAVDELMEKMDDSAWVQWIDQRLGSDAESGASTLRQMVGIFATTFGAVTGLVVIFFTGLYLSISPGLYERGALALAPPRHRERLAEVLSKVHRTLRHWLLGKVIAMAIIGVLTWAGLAALDVPLPVANAFIAALLTFIPNFGPVVSAIPPILLALAESPTKALWVVLLYIGIQFVESYLVTPYIQKQAIAMPPALIMISQVVLSILFGFLGLLVATPLTAAAIVVIGELYVKDVLEEEADDDKTDSSSEEVVDGPEDDDPDASDDD